MSDASPAAIPAALLPAWLEQSSDLLVLTGRSGTVGWANARFLAATGLEAGPKSTLHSLARADAAATRDALTAALESRRLAETDATGGTLFVRARAATASGQILWTLQDVTATRDGTTRWIHSQWEVLINLFSNAIKYNRRSGQVLVESRIEGSRVVLTVGDTGRGLAPDQIAQLFEPFNRLGVESEGIEGTGIGLTIVKALVEGMGGTVAVSSRRGQGTVFEVALPLATGDVAPAPAVPAPEPIAPGTDRGERTGQLLYIEDNAVNVMLVEELVKNLAGLQIASEPTGSAGVARARTLRPDVILVDLQLPDFDGFEVLRRLRALPETATTPCIALSANAMPEDIRRGIEAGFADYWTKPIDFKVFLSSLDKLFPAAAA